LMTSHFAAASRLFPLCSSLQAVRTAVQHDCNWQLKIRLRVLLPV